MVKITDLYLDGITTILLAIIYTGVRTTFFCPRVRRGGEDVLKRHNIYGNKKCNNDICNIGEKRTDSRNGHARFKTLLKSYNAIDCNNIYQ